jgi:hypothetical protein
MVRRIRTIAAAALVGLSSCADTPTAGPSCQEVHSTKPILPSQCGPTLDLTPINSYHGAIAAVADREDAVVLISGDCTGTLIAATAGPVVLTAGHCFDLGGRALLAFNVEADPDGDTLVTEGTVIEQSIEPDYALIRLDELPTVTPTLLTSRPSDLLAIIQHPRGGPKVVAEGAFASECNGLIFYTDLDTLVGSSGAGVLNRQGYLLGIHTDGDCAEDGSGSNFGWTAASIVQASSYLQDIDIGDR